MRESILPDSNSFENTGISKLLDDFFFVEEFRASIIVRFDTPDELRRARYHFL